MNTPTGGKTTGLRAIRAKVSGAHSLLSTQETRLLYAVAWEGFDERGLPCAEIDHCHAVDAAEALRIFWMTRSPKNTRVVGVAPAVGYHVRDAHGDHLEA